MTQEQKFKTAVHYICARSKDPSRLGATKLNKILFASDVVSYLSTGKPITGHKYKKMQFGPVPCEILNTLSALQAEGKIAVGQSKYHGFEKKDYVSLCDPDLAALDKDEIDLINFMIDEICDNHTATSISELTHDIVWDSAAMGEEIPLYAFLAAKVGVPSDIDKSWADQIIQKMAA